MERPGKNKNGVRFTYPDSVIGLDLVGRWADLTLAKRWVEFDIAGATQQVVGAIDQACLVPTFPERAGASVARIELPDVVRPSSCIMRPVAPTSGGVASRWTWLSISA